MPVLGAWVIWGGSGCLGLQGCPVSALTVWAELPLVWRSPLPEIAPHAALCAGRRPSPSLVFRSGLLHAECDGLVCAGAKSVSNGLPFALSRSLT